MSACLSIYPSFFLTSSPDLHVFGQAECSQPSRLLGTLKGISLLISTRPESEYHPNHSPTNYVNICLYELISIMKLY